MLLLTSEVCRWTAVRAARLAVSVLWQPVPAYRLAQTLTVMLPPRLCAATPKVKLPEWPGTAGPSAPVGAACAPGGWEPRTDRWRPSRSAW